jgi:hypothetical protein
VLEAARATLSEIKAGSDEFGVVERDVRLHLNGLLEVKQ